MKTHRIRFQTMAAISAAACVLSSSGTGRAAENETRSRAPSNVSISVNSSQKSSATAQLAGAAAMDRVARQGLLRPVNEGVPVKTVDDFRGREIIGADQQRLGQLEDFMVDAATGNLVYAVVAAPDEGALRLVQQSSLRLTAEGFVTELDQAAFDAAETVTREQLDADQIKRIPNQSWVVSDTVAQQSTSSAPATTPAIGLLPPSADSTSAATTAAAAHPDPVTPATTEPVEVTAAPGGGGDGELTQIATHLVRAGTLRGTDVRAGDDQIGTIEAIALDLDRGTATAVLAMTATGAQNKAKFHVPLMALKFAEVSNAGIATGISRADFERALSLSQVVSSAQQEPASADERLTPTGRTSDATPAAPDVSRTNLDTPKKSGAERTNASEAADSKTAGRSGASGSFNRDRATSGSGLSEVQPTPRTGDSEPGVANIPGGVDPADALAQVRAALGRDEAIATEAIEVNSIDGKIQLSGSVRSEEQKARIEAAARKAAGTTPVENKVTVQRR